MLILLKIIILYLQDLLKNGLINKSLWYYRNHTVFYFLGTHINKRIKNDRCKSNINRLMKGWIKCVGNISCMTEMQKAHNLVGNTKLKTTDRCL
jgi:hypothetical protein